MQQLTKPTKIKEVKREWHIIDVKGKILGDSAVTIAHLLMGKAKPYFVRNLDCGDYVVVINAKEVVFTGKKETEKVYTRYSGYPGGLSKKTVKELRVKNPTYIITHAVSGMLPKNRLRDRMLVRLKIFAGVEHPYGDKIKN